MQAGTLAAHAAQGSQAWSTLASLFQPWTPATPSPATPTPVQSVSLAGGESALRSAWSTLHALHLDALFVSHVVRDLLHAWVESTLVRQWWSHLDPFAARQLALFGRASAPRRFHPKLNAWILQAVTAAVRQANDSLQPIQERIAEFDRLVHACGSSEAVAPQFQRLIRTVFSASLSRPCADTEQPTSDGDRPEASAAALPLRSSMLHELLFKYYRLNFRAFHRCATAAGAGGKGAADEADEDEVAVEEEAEPDQSVDETMEATEREAHEMEDDAMEEEEKQAAAWTSPAETLDQFKTTCALLLSMHFLGSSAGDVAFPAATHASSSPPPSSSVSAAAGVAGPASLLAVSSWLTPSHFLDFFFILIEKYLRATCAGVWDRRKLAGIDRWMDERVKPFLQIILTGTRAPLVSGNHSSSSSSSARLASLLHWSSRLHFYSLECFGLLRIRDELFDMIKDYPDSLPALEDLRDVLSVTRQHQYLVDHLSRVFRTRLLQPGTNTRSILEQYAHTIACCRILDPAAHHSLLGGILERSAIGAYVKERKDAVRNVVRAVWGGMEERVRGEEDQLEEAADEQPESSDLNASLLSTPAAGVPSPVDSISEDALPGGLDLVSELETVPDATQFGEDSDAEVTLEEAEAATQAWHPEPTSGEMMAGSGAGGPSASSSSASSRYLAKADVLSLLIDLCGNGERNEELLLQDYKAFLAERLLAKRSRPATRRRRGTAAVNEKTQDAKDPLYDTEVEVTHLELMKLRFGEANPSLLDVEVMLKDILNSKRIRYQVANPLPNTTTTTTTTASETTTTTIAVAIDGRVVEAEETKVSTTSSSSSVSASSGPTSMFVRDLHHRRGELAMQVVDTVSLAATKSIAARAHAAAVALAPNFNALLLSSEFWPDMAAAEGGGEEEDDFSFRLPLALQSLLTSYAHLFHSLKTPRELVWHAAWPIKRGNVVQVELEMKDGRRELVDCEPIHAAILEKFAEPPNDPDEADAADAEERTEWSLSDLAAALEVDDVDILKSKLQFWLQRGFLRILPANSGSSSGGGVDDDNPVYQLVEHPSSADDDDDGLGGEADTVAGQLSEKQRRDQEAQVESYVLGSLGNFASLTVDRLHNMMKTISTSVSGFLYTKSEAELKILLLAMTQKGMLVVKDQHAFSKAVTLQQS